MKDFLIQLLNKQKNIPELSIETVIISDSCEYTR